MKIGIFGGSFNPPHLSHVAVCTFALSLTELDEVWVVPCYKHAFGKPMADYECRLQMCELAFCDLRRTRVSDIERQIGGTSYTVQTLEHLVGVRAEDRFSLIVGADAVRDRESWYQFDRITSLADLIVFGRFGVQLGQEMLPAPPECSSTEVRRSLAAGDDVRSKVPRKVFSYLQEQGLYVGK